MVKGVQGRRKFHLGRDRPCRAAGRPAQSESKGKTFDHQSILMALILFAMNGRGVKMMCLDHRSILFGPRAARRTC